MERSLPQGDMISGSGSFGGVELQGSMRVHHHQQQQAQQLSNPSVHEGFPLTVGTMNSSDQTISMADYDKGEKGVNPASDDDSGDGGDGGDGHDDANRGRKGSPWQRVKWTDKMVRLLITAVSYIGEDVGSDCGGGSMRRKFAVLQKKGKWKLVSKLMAERGHLVSPQQCEDKFNDLNKRYKKLNSMLGRGTSCQVVENPSLLDVIDYLTDKEKDDVRKILSSKHLFYEEMCSYHNGNRLHLPHDPALQHSLQLAIRSKDDQDNDDGRRHQHDDLDEDEHEVETDDHDEFEENDALHGALCGSVKRSKQCQGHGDVCFASSSQDGNKGSSSQMQIPQLDMNQNSSENSKAAWLQKRWIESRAFQLEEQKLQIQIEMLELEKQRFKWQRFSRKRDHELETLRIENERMKLENERMILELKHKEFDIKLN